MLPKIFLVAALILMLSLTICPAVLASSYTEPSIQWIVDGASYKEGILTFNGKQYNFTISLNGSTWEVDTVNEVEQNSSSVQTEPSVQPQTEPNNDTEPSIQWIVNDTSYKEAIVTVNETQYDFTMGLTGSTWKIATINGVQQNSSWIQKDITIPRPPYPWYVSMGDVPSFRIHLDEQTAVNLKTALAVIAALLALAAFWGQAPAAVAAALVAIILIGYDTLYGDHQPDGSWDLWVPYDWFNVLCAGTVGLYMATRQYWWFAILKYVPYQVCSHSINFIQYSASTGGQIVPIDKVSLITPYVALTLIACVGFIVTSRKFGKRRN